MLEERAGPRIAGLLAPEQERAAALVEATLPGMLLVRDGQIEGARADAPIQLRREPDELPDPALHDFYCRLLRATDDETFRLGHAIRLEPLLGLGRATRPTRASSRGCGSASAVSSAWPWRT